MHDFLNAAANQSLLFRDVITEEDIRSAIRQGNNLKARKDYNGAGNAYWAAFDETILKDHSYEIRRLLGESQGVIRRAQDMTRELLLELGHLYEDMDDGLAAVCCFEKAIPPDLTDTHAWSQRDRVALKFGVEYSDEHWKNLLGRTQGRSPAPTAINSPAPSAA